MSISEESSSSTSSYSIDIGVIDSALLERSFGVDDLAKENSKEWLQVFWDVSYHNLFLNVQSDVFLQSVFSRDAACLWRLCRRNAHNALI